MQHLRGPVQPGKSLGIEGEWVGVRCPWLRQMWLKGQSQKLHKAQILPQCYRNVASIYILEKMSVLFSEASELRTQRGVGGRLKREPLHCPDQFGVMVIVCG